MNAAVRKNIVCWFQMRFLQGAVMTAPLRFDSENVGYNLKTLPLYP